MFFIVPDNKLIKVYNGGFFEEGGLGHQCHIHGKAIRKVKVNVHYYPHDLSIPHSYQFEKEFYLIRLEDGTEFMEYERNDWGFYQTWNDSPKCCQDWLEKNK